MSNIVEYTEAYQRITEQTLSDMFGVVDCVRSPVIEMNSVETKKTFIVSLFYTGTVYGEYLLALDEQVAARIIGIDDPIDDANRQEVRNDLCDALSETLNVIVGEAVVELQDSYAKLTITAPRAYFGEIRYPQFRTGKSILQTPVGEVECFFCLDQMRLSLAASYEEAMQSMLDINSKLKKANQNLADQQAQLVQSEKMASIGVLASGVAHEINNPLFLMDMNLEVVHENAASIETLLQQYESIKETMDACPDAPADGRDEDYGAMLDDTMQVVAEARNGIERIKSIVSSLKEFSDNDSTGLTETDVNQLAKNACNLVSHLLPENCEIETQLGELPKIQCNSDEIGQVLLNVLTNAVQAVGDDAAIAIRSDHSEHEVMVTITDNGCGISDDDVDRLFDPFFSAKEEGEGSGLGLSIAYGLVRKHGGTIAIESTLGTGTKVTVRLPLVTEDAPCC